MDVEKTRECSASSKPGTSDCQTWSRKDVSEAKTFARSESHRAFGEGVSGAELDRSITSVLMALTALTFPDAETEAGGVILIPVGVVDLTLPPSPSDSASSLAR